MYESERLGSVGLPTGDYSSEIAELSLQVERIAMQVDDIWGVLLMLKTILEHYGPRDMVSAWSGMLEEWKKKRKSPGQSGAQEQD